MADHFHQQLQHSAGTGVVILSQPIIRGLSDKLYEKRKAAALEVERLVREALQANDIQRVAYIITCLIQDFAYSTQPNARNGGLIALAAASIALGSNDLAQFLDDIVPPVISCFSDPDSRVRYYACEAMYNVAKVARGEILKYFNEIFDALSKLVADSDPSVKTGSELLDHLIKDIVAEHSSFYPQELANEQLKDMKDPLDATSGSTNTDDSEAPAVYPSEPHLPRTPGSIPLLKAMKATTFNLPRFIPLLAERIRTLNPSTRMFLVQWIVTLDSIPDLEMVGYLPSFMDGLFNYLSDPNVDIRVAALNCLMEFLREMQDVVRVQNEKGLLRINGRKDWPGGLALDARTHSDQDLTSSSTPHGSAKIIVSPETPANTAQMPIPQVSVQSPASLEEAIPRAPSTLSMASAFYAHGTVPSKTADIDSPDKTTQQQADAQYKATLLPSTVSPGQEVTLELGAMVEILLKYLALADEETQSTALRWADFFIEVFREHMLPFTPELVRAILPNLAHSVDHIRTIAIDTNAALYKLVTEAAANPVPLPSARLSPGGEPSLLPPHMHQLQQQDLANSVSSATSVNFADLFDVQAAVDSLTKHVEDENEETRIASLEWMLMLHRRSPKRVLTHDEEAFHSLLKSLSDISEEVGKRSLQLLAQISQYSDDDFFMKFMVNLLAIFSSDRRLLETRGALIVRQLSLSLNPERMYRAFAEILERDDDLDFASTMVQNLNIILITAPELVDLRRKLKSLDTKDGLLFFAVLYRCWCHNPVATFALCLLAQAYEHAANLLQIFAELEVTVSFLVQVDKLVQLIESPVFTYLRLQLLEPDKHPYLFKCLFGIMMLLPQSSAFATLRNRLNSVQSMVLLYGVSGPLNPSQPGGGSVTYPASVASTSPQIPSKSRAKSGSTSSEPLTLRWHELLTHFRNVQARHERIRRAGQRAMGLGNDRGSINSKRKGTSRAPNMDDASSVGGYDVGNDPSATNVLYTPPSSAASGVSATPANFATKEGSVSAPRMKTRQPSVASMGGSPDAESISSLDQLDRAVFSGGPGGASGTTGLLSKDSSPSKGADGKAGNSAASSAAKGIRKVVGVGFGGRK